jgi:hypothetical protein
MKRNQKMLWLLSVLVVMALACAVSPGGGETTDPGDPNILFQDDFSSTSSGWSDTYRDESGMTDYDQGGFRIQVLQTNFDYWANPNLNFTDTSVEVDATKIGGPDDNDFGIICRYTGVDNFYFLLATSDGFYAIGKYSNGTQSLIGSDSFLETDKVTSGNTTNHLRADCVGSTLTLYINGTQVHSVTDTDHTSGDVGLMAGTFEESGTDILFDNFVVRKP